MHGILNIKLCTLLVAGLITWRTRSKCIINVIKIIVSRDVTPCSFVDGITLCFPLKMKAFDMLVPIYKTTWRLIPDDRNFDMHHLDT
jgi:hypothetical protein